MDWVIEEELSSLKESSSIGEPALSKLNFWLGLTADRSLYRLASVLEGLREMLGMVRILISSYPFAG